MPKSTWTSEELSLLEEIFPKMTTREAAAYFPNKTICAVKEKANVLGLQKDRKYCHLTDDQKKMIVEKYATTFSDEIAKELGVSIGVVHRYAYSIKLKKDKDLIKKLGEPLKIYGTKFRFKHGDIPFTKGKRREEYMSPEGIRISAQHHFKPGHRPINAKPVGYETTDTNGYVKVKVGEPNSWRFKHHIVWETNFGPIPKGFNVQIRNKILTDLRPENLYLITRREQLLTENGTMAIPEEFKETYKIMRKLKKQIKRQEQNE